ncbi:hypothetical protein [Streptococcus pneumoniae]|uniref:hypothetical protein n=1 Tax=Streptococcus pneumoniae TaxID=1313 RepID=UPI0015DB6768|nr:hypothetical protein [Streptococcus pneumoniae]
MKETSRGLLKTPDRTDEVSLKHVFEVVDETDEVSNHIYGKATLTSLNWIFAECKLLKLGCHTMYTTWALVVANCTKYNIRRVLWGKAIGIGKEFIAFVSLLWELAQ